MKVYSIWPGSAGQQTQPFQSNRDMPIIAQPQINKTSLGRPEPEEPVGTSSQLHAIEYLKYAGKLFIQQNIELLEVVLGIEARKKYQVLDPMGQKVLLAYEESNNWCRIFYESVRKFDMHMYDNLNNEVIKMQRHFALSCGPFWLNKLEVFCPTDVVIGSVQEEFSFFKPKFGIFDRDNMKVLQIEGSNCQCNICNDVTYNIKNTTGEIVGTISKQWMGFLQEGFTDADSFRLEINSDLDVYVKMVLLGATFLIDYLHYEDQKTLKVHHECHWIKLIF